MRATIEDPDGLFTDLERRTAEWLVATDRTVRALPRGATRTADAEVDGEPTEFKHPGPGADSGRIKNEVSGSLKNGGQARRIVVDARGSGVRREEAERALARMGGITRGKLDHLLIIGDNFDVSRRYSSRSGGG